MQIKLIHSMCWGNADHTAVGLNADTDTGINEEIGTPYDATSIIWDAVRAFPVGDIVEYVAPSVPKT